MGNTRQRPVSTVITDITDAELSTNTGQQVSLGKSQHLVFYAISNNAGTINGPFTGRNRLTEQPTITQADIHRLIKN